MKTLLFLILSSIVSFAQFDVNQKNNTASDNLLFKSFSLELSENHLAGDTKVLDEIVVQTVENGSLVNMLKLFYNYDVYGNVSCRGTANWVSNSWIGDRRTCYEFNTENNKTLEYDQELIGGKWFTHSQQIFTYDEKGQLIRLLWQDNRNDYNNEIENSHAYDYSYDEAGNQIEETSSMWLDWEYIPRWEYQSKRERVFNNSLLKEEYYHWWNSMNSAWETTSKTVCSYDQNNNLSLTESYFYEEGDWMIDRRIQILYDDNNNLIDSLEQNWRDGVWQNSSQTQCEYSNNLLSKEMWFWWDYTDGSLMWSGVNSYQYNEYNLLSEFLEESYNKGVHEYSRKVNFYYDTDNDLAYLDINILENGKWTYLAKNIYNYITITETEKDDILNSEYILSQNYPNPFNPNTTIKYQLPLKVKSERANVKLIIFDILGREVATLVNQKQKPGSYEVEFNCHSGNDWKLTSGIYFYRLQVYAPERAGDFVETKKMMLLK